MRDMPKIECPFKRVTDAEGHYVVVDEIAEGMEWVFNDSDVLCTEKLDGTCSSVLIEGGKVTAIFTRAFDKMMEVPFFTKGKEFISEGMLEAFKKGYMDNLPDGQYFGETIGPKQQGNPYELDRHLWVPFDTHARSHLAYKSWGKYPKTYATLSAWFEKDIFSLFIRRIHNKAAPPEGVVFVQPSTGKMAKLRRDMFPWAAKLGIRQHKPAR